MEEKLKIFISSPIKGLEEVRKVLIEALEKEYSAEAMELWVSSPEHPKNVCLAHVRNSDAMILLSGPYYGSIDSTSGKSFTELEYEEAEAYGIDILHFHRVAAEGNEFTTGETDEELKQKHLQFFKKIWQFRNKGFVTPQQAKEQVLEALKVYKSKKRERLRPFVKAEEYFKDFLKKGPLRHDYRLVGRSDMLDALNRFTCSDKKILVLFGRGGLGKSKILYEFASHFKDKKWKHVLFLREVFNIDQDILDMLPVEPSVIILDDAHRYDDLDTLFSIYKGNPVADKIKLIISARPLGKEKINYNLSRNVPLDDVETCELDDLDVDETAELVKSLLLRKDPRVISAVTNMTKDCPLATVVACSLVNEGRIDPNIVLQKEEFQRLIFDRFLEEYKGSDLADAQTQRLLEYIAALSPTATFDDEFRKKLGDPLAMSISDVAKRIALLEERSLLLRKGRLVKIVPDLLSDYILYQACIDRNDTPTNFAKEVLDKFHETHLKNILFNISEIEWRARLSSKNVNLLGDVWKQIKDEFRNAPIYLRLKIIDEIEQAAVFQPQHALEIVDIAINVPPSTKLPDEPILRQLEWSNDRVLDKLPKLLRQIAYNIDYFEASCDLLWSLGKKEMRELNPYPECPLRILLDLAEYGIRKPKIYNLKMLKCIKRWLQEDDAYQYRYSPLDILIKLLAKEGEDTQFRVDKIIMGAFPLNFRNIDDLRKEALTILESHLNSSKPKHIIAKALDLLVEVLRYPPGLFGREPTQEEMAYLGQEQNNALDIILKAIPTLRSDVINSIIRKDLRWYQLHGRTPEIKSAVKKVIDSIEETDTFRITRAMIGNFREFLEQDFSRENHDQAVEKEMREVASIIFSKYGSADSIFNSLNSILKDIFSYKLSASPNYILSQLSKDKPEIALGISKLIVINPDREISRFFSSLIWPLRLNGDFKAKINEIIKEAITKQDYWPCLNIAHAFSYGVDEYTDEDIENIKNLLMLKNEDITKSLVHGISKIGQKNPKVAFQLSLLIDLEQFSDITDDFCSIFEPRYGVCPDYLSAEQIQTLLEKLLKIDIFERQHYHADQLLKNIAHKSPDVVIEFLLKRLEYARDNDIRSRDYAPLPYLDFEYDFFDTNIFQESEKYMQKVLGLSINPAGLDIFWLPKLFKLLSSNFSGKSIIILTEWIKSSREEKNITAISFLLREANQGFLFSQYEFIGILLEAAAAVSAECLKNVKSNLFGIAVSGGSTRSHGQPSQKDVELKDRGRETSNNFELTHPGYKFYREISEYGETRIREELERDREMEYE